MSKRVSIKERCYSVMTLSLVGLMAWYGVGLPTSAQVPTRSPSVPTFPQDDGFTPSNNPLPTESDYILGAGDRLRIAVYQVPDFSGEFLVLVDGTITLPLIGTIKADGMTIPQLSDLLSKRYSNYLKRPIVTVSVITPRPLQIAVAGEVISPGSYTIALQQGQKVPLVTDLIRQAGGVTTVADISQVQLRRRLKGQEQVRTLNLIELIQQGSLSQDLTVRDGDSIFIPSQETISLEETRLLTDANFGIRADREINVAVVGEVYRPGSYRIVPSTQTGTAGGTSIQRQPPRLTQAIQQAGGIKPLADIRQIELRRYQRNGTQQTIEVDLWNLLQTGDITEDVFLQEGDSIIIPTATEILPEEAESLATASFSPPSIRVNIVGQVVRPGAVEVPSNTPLNQAILAAGGFDKRRANDTKIELIRLNPDGTVTKRDIPIDFSEGITDENNPLLRNNDVVIVNRNWLTATTDTIGTIFSPIGAALGFINVLSLFGISP